jgi:hypothetical protein
MIKDAIVSVSRSPSRFGWVVELFWCFGCLARIATVRFHGATAAITYYPASQAIRIVYYFIYWSFFDVTDIVFCNPVERSQW